ncbi:MAG: hypothetical protein P8Z35_01750 [Ignavibacteriaceae bacterium]
MKKQYFFFYALLSGLIFFGCNKPAPTELIQDNQTAEDPAQVEVITTNINDESYSNGYDSTGVADSLLDHVNTIYVSGIKISSKLGTVNTSLAEAIFFDKTKPVYVDNYLIGFRTLTPGIIRFNNYRARLIPLKVRIRNSSADSSLGLMYFLYSGRAMRIDPFDFKYNSNIDFQFNPLIGSLISFKIPTPPEITATIRVDGKRSENDLKALLEWSHPLPGRNINIIIGAVDKINGSTYPIYRIRTKDDGKYQIPENLLNQIPFDRFNKIVLTLVRKFQKYEKNNENGNDLYILSQSVHTLIIDLQ